MDIAQEMLETFNGDPDLLKKVITGNESCVYDYDIETKVQSSQWKHPRPKKTRQVLSNMKVLLTVFFNCNGMLHYQFLHQGRTSLKLCVDCVKQFVRNARICGRTNYGFYTTITLQFSVNHDIQRTWSR